MFFHKPSMTSTCNTSESIAAPPPGSDLDDDQIRNMVASPLYLQERELSADQSRVDHSFRERSVSSSSHLWESAGKLAGWCSRTKESSDRERISSGHQTVQGKGESFFKFSDPEEATRTVLEEQRDHQLAEAKSEILKQECKVDTLNTCIRELQRQAHSNRLELDSVNCVYEESRREQARLHEELSHRERAHRETQIRSTKGRIEKSSGDAKWRILQKWIARKSGYSVGAHFTNTGVARKNELYAWFKIISRSRIDLQWKIISRSQSAGRRSKSSIYVEPLPKPAIRYMELVWDTGKRFFWPSTSSEWFITDTYLIKEFFTLRIKVLQVQNSMQKSTGRPVAKSEEQIGSTVPMPSLARRPSTMNSFFPAEVPQNSKADLQRLQISELQFEKLPTLSTFPCWKTGLKTQVSSCSSFPRKQCCGSKWRWSMKWMN